LRSISAPAAAIFYSGLAVVLTWPLVFGIAGDVPGDLGDSLLNMWILAWGAEHLPRVLAGAMSWGEFWNANIFHPEPLSLALSEHLFGQVLQILPIYWLTGNIILCYNLLFVTSFALSAFGVYLLVRDLTGNPRAAFIAGLIYGFLPYRIASVPHLQVLSSQWMPFALYGLNRFVTTGSKKALAGGTAALVMQNWSCGYYLLYFAPFVALFVLHRMWTEGVWRDVKVWTALTASAAATVALTLPFLLPYRDVQQRFGLERSLGEVVNFSANVWSYVTASQNIWLWGRVLRFYERPEGEAFLGFIPWLLAFVALAAVLAQTRSPQPDAPRLRWLKILLLIVVVTQSIAMISAVMFGGFDLRAFGLQVRARTVSRLFAQFAIAAGMLLYLSPRLRGQAARLTRAPAVFCLFAAVLAMWLSLGPRPAAGDSMVSGFGLYGVLYESVPGFNGLRVPARLAMVAGLFLAILAGYGATIVNPGDVSVRVLCFLIALEGFAVPIEINRTWATQQAMPPARVFPHSSAPEVYRRIAALPRGSVITEFPFGDGAWEIRYTFYAAAHWKPITNGYSGAFPPRYKERVARLMRVAANPDAAWQTLRDSGTTHVVVHPNAFAKAEDADAIESWLKSHGAREVERFADGAMLFSVIS